MQIEPPLLKEFIKACANVNGQFLTRPGHLDCLLNDTPQFIFTLDSKSTMKVETRESYVEMKNVKSIMSQISVRRVKIVNKEQSSFIIRSPAPEHFLLEFDGNIKGIIMVHKKIPGE